MIEGRNNDWDDFKIERYMNRIWVLGFLLFAVSSCYYDNGEDLYPTDPNDCKTDSLTYDGDIKAIFSNSCAVSGCHITGVQPPSLETYSEVKASLSRIEQRALVQKDMPTGGPLSSCDQEKLKQWIADGAPEK